MGRKQRKAVNTDNQVKALKPESSKYAVKVKDQTGLYLRVTPRGFKSYAAVALDPYDKQIWATLGGADVLTPYPWLFSARVDLGVFLGRGQA